MNTLPSYIFFCTAIKKRVFILSIIFFTLASLHSTAEAAYQQFEAGTTAVIGEFVYEDDFTASTADCAISITDPSGTPMVTNAAMSELANGWHYYNYSVPALGPQGVWPATMTCGTVLAGDLVSTDKTFTVGPVVASTTSIATAVWGSATRTLTSFGTLAADVWSSATRTLTGATLDSGSLALQADVTAIKTKTDTINWADVTAIKAKTDTIAWADVTSIKTKTDTINWSDVTGLVTTAGTIQGKTDTIVWTDVTGIKTKTDTIVWGDVTTIKTNVATLISEVGTGQISGIKTKTDTIAWADVTGIVTSTGAIQAKTDTIAWADVTAIKTKTDTIDWTNVTGIKTKTDTISWTDVTGIKTKTDTIVWGDVTTIKTNVATLITEVGTGNISGIKTKTDTIAWADVTGIVTSTGAIQAKTDTIAWADVTAVKTKTDTIDWTNVTGIKTKTDTISWTDVTGIKTKTDTIVWGDVTTIKTNVATLITEVGTGQISGIKTKTDTINWSDVTGIVTSTGAIQAKTDTIAWADVTAVKTKTDTIAWTDVTGIKTKTDTIVWSDVTTIGTNVTAIKAKTDTIAWADITNMPTNIWSFAGGRTLTSFGTLAADVWSNATRTLTASTLNTGSLALQSDVTAIKTKTDTINWSDITAIKAKTDTIAWLDITNMPASVWGYAAGGGRTLTSFGTLPADVWSSSVRSLTVSSAASWNLITSNFGALSAGSNYLATVSTIYNSTLTDALTAPTVTIYDPSRNIVVNSVPMTRTAAGTYTYSYTTASSAAAGTWESVFTTNVEAGKTIVSNDYWTVAASPAQVIIHGVTDATTPTISADATITNEGSTGYEYQYEWCVVSNINNPCGGGDDVFHATAAKFINPGDDFNTTLTATVPAAGNYYFKVVAYFGIDSSGASRTFTATSAATGGTGGAGGSGASASTPVTTPTTLPEAGSCMGADFNHDHIVNSVDFSILLAYWKTLAPFANKCVDINRDSVVNSVDFSILLSQWGTPGKAI